MDGTESNADCFDAGLNVGPVVSSGGVGEPALAVGQDAADMSESLKSGGTAPVELAAGSAAGLVPRATTCESQAQSDAFSVLPGQDDTSPLSCHPLSSVQGPTQTVLTPMSSVPSDTVPVSSVQCDTVSVSPVPSDTVIVSPVPSDTVIVSPLPSETVPVSSVPIDTVSVPSVSSDTVSVSSLPSNTVSVSSVQGDTVSASSMPSDTVPVSPIQGGNVPVSLIQSSTAPVLPLQNNTFPVSLVQSDTASSPLQNDTASVSLQNDTASVSLIENGIAPVSLIHSSTVPVSLIHSGTAPVSLMQSFNAPVSLMQSFTAPVSLMQSFTAPVSLVRSGTIPVLSVQSDTIPVSSVQSGTIPVSSVQCGTIPVSSVQSGTIPVSSVQSGTIPVSSVQSGTIPVSSVQSGGVSPACSPSPSSLMDMTAVSLARDDMTCDPAAVVTVSSCALDMETDPSQCVSAELTPAAYVQCMDTSGESEPVLTPLSVSNNSANGSFLNQADDDTMETEPSVGCTAHLDEDSTDDGFLKPNAVGSPTGDVSGDATEFTPYTPPSSHAVHLQQILNDVGISEQSPSPEPELHCLVCNVHLDDDELTVPLDAVLESFTERVADKLGTVINNDYKLYLHSDVVCDNCHKVLTEIHHQELETKKLKDLVVADFWDTVELRGIRPQRRGRRRGRPSKLQLEAEQQRQFIPEMDQFRDPPDVYHLPPKKTAKSVKSKCYVKLGTNSYQCVRCLKLFPRMRSARKHYELLHGKKEEHCLQCNKFFRHRSLLVKHRQRVHGVVMSDEEEEETAAGPEEGPAPGSSSDPAAGPSEVADAEHPPPPDDNDAWQRNIDPADPDSAVKFEPDLSVSADDAAPDPCAVAAPDPDPATDGQRTDGRQLRQHLHRAPVIQDDDEEEAEMMMVDMDVIMNVNGEPIQRRRRSVGRPRRRQSLVSPDDRHMYTEVPPAPESNGVAPRFQCLLCTNSYSRQSKARDHFMAKHAQLPRFSCNVCAQMFLTYKQKRHHELSHTAEACGKCGKKYPGNRRGMLERHVIQCGQLKKCKDCEAEFDSVADCLKHRREVHDKTAACEVCGKVVSARNLGSHRAIHSDERNYTCHLCGASFKAKGSLDTHLRTHSEERPFTCTTCGRSFKHRNNWKDHERSHLNIRDYVCHFCSKTFKQSKNLKQHLRQHDANPEIFSCPHCPSTFKYKYNMLAHVKTLHTGELGRRVRRRGVRPSSELAMPGPSAGPSAAAVVGAAVSMAALHHHQQHHGLMTAADPLQMSPTSCDSNTSGLPAAVGGSAAAAAAMSQQNRALQQMGAISPNVVFMPSLQHHSIFS